MPVFPSQQWWDNESAVIFSGKNHTQQNLAMIIKVIM